MSGDLQAQRLLAREAQAAQPTQYSPRTVPSWIIDRGALNVQALFAPRLYRSLTARCRQGRRSRLPCAEFDVHHRVLFELHLARPITFEYADHANP
jgi:hypothetical protein